MPKLTEREEKARQDFAKDKYDTTTIRATYLRQAVSICGSGDLYRITRFCDWIAENTNPDKFWQDEPEVVALAFCYFRLVAFHAANRDDLTPTENMNVANVTAAIRAELTRRDALNLITGD